MLQKFILISFLFAFIFIFTSLPQADPGRVEIVLDLPDILVEMGSSGYLNIYFSNYYYDVEGFQFVLTSDRPDLVKFGFESGNIDTSGTLTSGFEYVEAIDRAGDQSEIWFRCIADLSIITGDVDPIYPQQGGIAVRLPYQTFIDTSSNSSKTANLIINKPIDFSDPFGYSIGVETGFTYDSAFYRCDFRDGSECTDWVEVIDTSQGYDTVFVTPIPYGYMDTTQVILWNGSITLEPVNCDFTGSGQFDISDLLCLVDYMFAQMDPVVCPIIHCDTDNNNQLDISDLLNIIEYMFNSDPLF